MNSETAKKLEGVLANRQRQKQAATTRAAEQQSAVAKNIADFAAKKHEVIKPAFQEIIDLYAVKGFDIRIVEEDERPNNTGGIHPASVHLDMAKRIGREILPRPFVVE